MTEQIYKDKVIERTVLVKGGLTDTSIGTWQADYPLREVEYVHIRNNVKSKTYACASAVFLTTFGFGLNMLAKWYSQTDDTCSQITKGEWIVIGCGLFISVVLYLIGIRLPNERKKVMNDIDSHFKSAPKSRQAVKGVK